jgi:endonuclease/exonuclease/phosphatase family metal-dependent hydrolase
MKTLVRIAYYSVLLLLALSSLAGWVPPSASIIPALSGLAFPIFWLVSFSLLVLVIIMKLRFLVITGLLITITTFPIMWRYISIDLKSEIKNNAYTLFNFNTFGLRIPGAESKQLECQDSINRILNARKYTVACFQEFPMKGARHAKFYEKLMNDLKISHKSLSKYDPQEKSTQYILVTASEFPVLHQNTLQYEGLQFAMYTDIKFPDKIIRLYNVHLKSVKLTSEKRLLVYDKSENIKERLVDVRDAIRKLSIAFIHREKQADLLVNSIKQSPYPVMIAGDFNDMPASYSYHQIISQLKDASFMSVNGFKRTYKHSTFPLQIDYILHDKQIRSSGYRRIELNISDHYAVSTVFTTGK